MAGDFFTVDCDLEDKIEVGRICELTDLDVDVVVGRLVRFWAWVDRHCVEGVFQGGTAKTLCRIIGGDPAFWETVALVGWLRFTEVGIEIPGFERRFSKSAKTRILTARRVANFRARQADVTDDAYDCNATPLATEQNRTEQKNERRSSDSEPLRSTQRSHARATKSALTLSDLENAWGEESLAIVERVEEIFSKAGYSGADGKVFWEAAFLEVTRKILPSFVDSALRACELKAQDNPPAYFRKVLVDECTKGGKDFGELARLVRFPTGMKFGPPPRAAPADPVAQFASASKLPGDCVPNPNKTAARRAADERRSSQ